MGQSFPDVALPLFIIGSTMRAFFSLVLSAGLLLSTVQATVGQNTEDPRTEASIAKPNALYVEGLGNGGLLSWNYERMASPTLGMRAGIAAWTASDFWGGGEASFLNFPLTLSYLPGGRGSGWEVGGGLLVGRVKESASRGIVNLTAILGYRWVSGGGWLYRAGFTPFYSLAGDYPDDAFFPSIGLSFGKTF
jgi:hypothetical protein